MDILLDTQVFLWGDTDPARLSPGAKGAMADPENRLFLSVASIWEMQIKSQLGKLQLRVPLKKLIREQVEMEGVTIQDIEEAHVHELASLPDVHRDPFERLIVVTAKCEGWTVISSDPMVREYPVSVLW